MELEARPYQDRVVEKVIGYFEAGDEDALIESPTGSGKTIMGLRVAKYFEETRGWKTNWVAMRRNLLRQVEEANRRFFNCARLTTVSMFAKTPPRADLTIVDEAQHDATASCVHIHAQSGSRAILGLSATPFRTDKLKISFRRVVRDAGIHRLIHDGYLSPYHHWVIDKWTPERVAHTWLRERERWGKSIVFFRTIAECNEFARRVNQGAHRCEVVTAKTHRERQLAAFKRGDFQVVANVGVLCEGFDCPTLRTVFVRDSGKLPTIQMAGRAFRRAKDKLFCNVVQSAKSRHPFTKTARPECAHVRRDNRWLALGNSDKAIECAREMVTILAKAQTRLPDFLMSQPPSHHFIPALENDIALAASG